MMRRMIVCALLGERVPGPGIRSDVCNVRFPYGGMDAW